MAIEGLRTVPQSVEVKLNSDDVGATVEALSILGLVEDHDQVTESVTSEFGILSTAGIDGEPYIQLPRSLITLRDLIDASDSATYPGDRKYPESYVWDPLWTPGTTQGSYEQEDLDNLTSWRGSGNFAPHARLAAHGTESSEEPLLHFLNKPYDDKYAKRREQTQLDAVEEAIAAYHSEQFAMTPLNTQAVAMIALTRRIKGQQMPMAWGFMRDATLPRREVDGVSVVGDVGSYGGQLGLYRSYGGSNPYSGVGLSVGPKDL